MQCTNTPLNINTGIFSALNLNWCTTYELYAVVPGYKGADMPISTFSAAIVHSSSTKKRIVQEIVHYMRQNRSKSFVLKKRW